MNLRNGPTTGLATGEKQSQSTTIETFKLIGEILSMILCQSFYILVGIYRCFVPRNEESVRDKIVLITGSGHGIGRETAKKYARCGAVVVCVDVNETGNKETVDSISKEGGKAYDFVCDVSDRVKVMNLVQDVKRTVGVVSILVNNAGIMPSRPLPQQTEKEIRSVFDINVLGNLWMIQALLPDMIAQQRGHIVAISSTAAMSGLPNLVSYCSTKYAVRGYMDALIEEMRHTAPFIKFTTIYPYMVDTGLIRFPRIRFAASMKLLTTEMVADSIVTSQRRGLYSASIPANLLVNENIQRLLPLKCRQLGYDFLRTGVNAD